MDMSVVEKRKNLKVRAMRRNIEFVKQIASLVCSFLALFAVLNSNLNMVSNPSIGSYVVSIGVCVLLFGSFFKFVRTFN